MKKIIALFLVVAVACATNTALAASSTVKGYTKKNGTYVQRHKRTQADFFRFNNWSTRGNTNPYTGKRGHIEPYAPKNRWKVQ